MDDAAFRDRFAAMLRNRRSHRDFLPDALPEDEVREFLELVMTSPSAFNMQARAVVRIQDPDVRAAVHAAARKQRQVLEAPLLLAFVAEPDGWEDTFDEVASQYLASGRWDDSFAAEKRTASPVSRSSAATWAVPASNAARRDHRRVLRHVMPSLRVGDVADDRLDEEVSGRHRRDDPPATFRRAVAGGARRRPEGSAVCRSAASTSTNTRLKQCLRRPRGEPRQARAAAP